MTGTAREDCELQDRFQAHVEAFINDELEAGTEPVKLALLLVHLAVEIAKGDPVTAYASVNLFADVLRSVADQYRS